MALFGAGAWQRVASVMDGKSLAGMRSVRVVGDNLCVALTRVDGREWPLSGVAADARGHGASSDGWPRTCQQGIWRCAMNVAGWGVRL